MDILCILISSMCGFAVGASTVALFTINGKDWGDPPPPDEHADIDYSDIPAFLRRQAD